MVFLKDDLKGTQDIFDKVLITHFIDANLC